MGKAPTGGTGLPHDVGVRSAADPASDDTALSAAVSAAQDGDEDAFRVLYRTIQPGLIRYLWVQVGAAAEDVASETWLQVARDLRKLWTMYGISAACRRPTACWKRLANCGQTTTPPDLRSTR
jgi:hypothetical protein